MTGIKGIKLALIFQSFAMGVLFACGVINAGNGDYPVSIVCITASFIIFGNVLKYAGMIPN